MVFLGGLRRKVVLIGNRRDYGDVSGGRKKIFGFRVGEIFFFKSWFICFF